MSPERDSFGHLGVYVGPDWLIHCNTYPDHTPILDINAGRMYVAVSIDGDGADASAVEFARALARDVQKFAEAA